MSERERYSAIVFGFAILAAGLAWGDQYDPVSPTYYSTATGTGSDLKSQLHDIIDNHSVIPYNSNSVVDTRTALQKTDVIAAGSGFIYTVYDLRSQPLNVAAINPGGSIPGWDSGTTWNREHVWPQSRGVTGSGPATSDLFNLRPSITSHNGARGSLNFGGAYGTSTIGTTVNDGGTVWYPGNAEAGMIARQMFYMAVRYDGSDSIDLEITNGNPANPNGDTDPPPQLGSLARMLEWNYAVVPDDFERRRNQIIDTQYQHNRDPFIDHPEWVWSVFAGQNNSSQISLAGTTVGSDGSSTRNLDLGHVFVGGALPNAQNVTVTKNGNDGTYYSVTTDGDATSSVTGRFNAFKTNTALDSRVLSVGLSSTTATAGIKTGTVTIDNLDITTGAGSGQGAGDQNDVINLSYAVLDHARSSFDAGNVVTTLTHDFGNIAAGSIVPSFQFDVSNLATTLGATAGLDFDSLMSSGDTSSLTTDLAGSAGALTIAAGASHVFNAMINTATPGMFSATYTLSFSESFLGQSVPGELTKTLMLTLAGQVTTSFLTGDYNRDGFVDAADFTIWRDTLGTSGTAFDGADGDGNMMVDEADYQVWVDHFGETSSPGSGATSGAVPEPSAVFLLICGWALLSGRKRN